MEHAPDVPLPRAVTIRRRAGEYLEKSPGKRLCDVEDASDGEHRVRTPLPRLGPRGTAKLRLELAALGVSLTRRNGGIRAALALSAAYGGERTIALGFGDVQHVKTGPLTKLLLEACRLVQPWGSEARIELRSLRPPVRRALLAWLAERDELVLVACARRTVVVTPAAALLRADAVPDGLRANRRRVLLLAARDGGHCVWCRKPLTHLSVDATVDHVRCRSHGGSNSLENLVLACASCNHKRANAPAHHWLTRCLADGAPVDVDAITTAIDRSTQHHEQRLGQTLHREPGWAETAAA